MKEVSLYIIERLSISISTVSYAGKALMIYLLTKVSRGIELNFSGTMHSVSHELTPGKLMSTKSSRFWIIKNFQGYWSSFASTEISMQHKDTRYTPSPRARLDWSTESETLIRLPKIKTSSEAPNQWGLNFCAPERVTQAWIFQSTPLRSPKSLDENKSRICSMDKDGGLLVRTFNTFVKIVAVTRIIQ